MRHLAPVPPDPSTRYSGAWEAGLKQGEGAFTYANGDVFTVS